jgi:hypothetical protein
MGGFNLPPGVSVGDIPGNRPQDLAEEAFWGALNAAFEKEHPVYTSILKLQVWEKDDDNLMNAFLAYAEMARDMGFDRGAAEAQAEHQMAETAKQEEAFAEQQCAVCGETLGYDYDRAEVVLISTKHLAVRPHLIIHADGCFNDQEFETA